MRLSCVLVCVLCLTSGRPSACKTQGTTGLAAAGASLTLERLFAVPTDAYTNAYGEAGVDMRPAVPVSNLGGVIKLALPTLALSETASSLGAAPAVRAKTSSRSGLLQDGAVAARTQSLSRSAALTASALASVDHQSGLAKAVAQARLKRKHNLLAAMKREHTDASDAGPSQHGRNAGKKGLDGQISGSGKWLAKAVMWLAIVAGTCILGGICAVIYCYSNRHQGDTDLTKIPTKEQQLNGKNFGRATPQYGSYGAKRR